MLVLVGVETFFWTLPAVFVAQITFQYVVIQKRKSTKLYFWLFLLSAISGKLWCGFFVCFRGRGETNYFWDRLWVFWVGVFFPVFLADLYLWSC